MVADVDLAADGTLVKELWPSSYPLLTDRTDPYLDIVPASVEEKAQWAYVGPKINSTDRSRRYALYYLPTSKDDISRVQVSIRLQGFVQRHKIGALGNWSGYVLSQTNILFPLI